MTGSRRDRTGERALGRTVLFGYEIDAVTMADAVTWVRSVAGSPRNGHVPYVVTPNVHHTVAFQSHEGLRAAYADAALVIADGAPLVWASRVLGAPLPERVAGSELVPRLFDSVALGETLSVYLLGAEAGVADRAAERIHARWPSVSVVGTYSPPFGFEHDPDENGQILGRIAEASPDVLMVGLGAPKQETWVHAHRARIEANVALCIGASIDFLAGHKPQAPVWMRKAGVEWLHRVATEPRRLAGRYVRDGSVFPRIVWQEWRSERHRSSARL